MWSFLTGLFWRLIIGIGIAAAGVLVSLITNDWNIEYWWFGGFGILMILFAALPFFGGGASTAGMAWYKPDAANDEYKNSRLSSGGSMNWSITAFIIGIINLLASVFVYHIHQ